MTTPTYPYITVQLTGTDDNGFALISRVATALKRDGIPREQIIEFLGEASIAPTYDELLAYLAETVNVT